VQRNAERAFASWKIKPELKTFILRYRNPLTRPHIEAVGANASHPKKRPSLSCRKVRFTLAYISQRGVSEEIARYRPIHDRRPPEKGELKSVPRSITERCVTIHEELSREVPPLGLKALVRSVIRREAP
jgi:hypothetical protein